MNKKIFSIFIMLVLLFSFGNVSGQTATAEETAQQDLDPNASTKCVSVEGGNMYLTTPANECDGYFVLSRTTETNSDQIFLINLNSNYVLAYYDSISASVEIMDVRDDIVDMDVLYILMDQTNNIIASNTPLPNYQVIASTNNLQKISSNGMFCASSQENNLMASDYSCMEDLTLTLLNVDYSGDILSLFFNLPVSSGILYLQEQDGSLMEFSQFAKINPQTIEAPIDPALYQQIVDIYNSKVIIKVTSVEGEEMFIVYNLVSEEYEIYSNEGELPVYTGEVYVSEEHTESEQLEEEATEEDSFEREFGETDKQYNERINDMIKDITGVQQTVDNPNEILYSLSNINQYARFSLSNTAIAFGLTSVDNQDNYGIAANILIEENLWTVFAGTFNAILGSSYWLNFASVDNVMFNVVTKINAKKDSCINIVCSDTNRAKIQKKIDDAQADINYYQEELAKYGAEDVLPSDYNIYGDKLKEAQDNKKKYESELKDYDSCCSNKINNKK